jgi:2'-5' RNA ligase
MRCFVAVEVSAPVRRRAVELQEALRKAEADVRWVEEKSLHLTLKFLGEIGEDQVARLKDLLGAEAARWPRLNLEVAGAGCFPSHGPPRVVWAGLTGDLEKLAGLAAAVERAAEQVGVPREGRPFVAHLTLGRVKSARNAKRLAAAVAGQDRAVLGKDEISEIVLFESTLTGEGPVYGALGRFPLGPA